MILDLTFDRYKVSRVNFYGIEKFSYFSAGGDVEISEHRAAYVLHSDIAFNYYFFLSEELFCF